MNDIKHYLVTTVDGRVTKITERKTAKRDKFGRFTSDFTFRFRARAKGTCAYAAICPFHASTGIEKL